MAGLVGMEVYYKGYSADDVAGLLSLANKHKLIATGGSDYHGLPNNVETTIGGVDVPLRAAERLIALAKQ